MPPGREAFWLEARTGLALLTVRAIKVSGGWRLADTNAFSLGVRHDHGVMSG